MKTLKALITLPLTIILLTTGWAVADEDLDPSDPADNILAWVKLHGNTDGGDVFRYGHLTAYGQPNGEKSQKLFQMVSLTKVAYKDMGDGNFESRTWGCGLYADPDTGEFIDEFTNPYNDKKITLKPYCGNISGSIFDVKEGLKSIASFQMESTVFGRPYILDWIITGDKVTVSRSAATQWEEKSSGKTKYESSVDTFHTTMSELSDKSLTSVDARYQYTLSTEWMTMLDMGTTPGYMLWAGSTTKHDSLDEIPSDFLEAFEQRLGKEKLLRPLWEEVDMDAAKATIDTLMDWWPGNYNNDAQVAKLRAEGKPVWQADDTGKGGHIEVTSHYRKVDMPSLGDNVLYVEETKYNDPSAIFRQRLYTLKPDPQTGDVRVKLYYFNDKKKYVGAWKDLSRLDDVTEDALFASPDGCDLIVSKQDEKYHMKMGDKACVFGDRYFNYQVLLGENSFWFRDKINSMEDDSIVSVAGDFTYHELDQISN